MNKSPAILHRANKIPTKPLIAYYRNLEFSTFLPVQPEIPVKKFLKNFAIKNLNGDLKYYDLELYDKEKVLVNYERKIDLQFFKEKYYLYLSKLSPETIMDRMDIYSEDKYEIMGFSNPDQLNSDNFFSKLIEAFPKYKISESVASQYLKINNVFNSESLIETIEENKKKNLNPWLYHEIPRKNLSMINIKEWDEIFYKNVLTQIFNFVSMFNKDIILDVDTSIKGLDTCEVKVDMYIRSKDDKINIPLNIVNNIDEIEIFDSTRKKVYNYYFPYLYPLYLFELFNPKNPEDLTPEVLGMLENVNKKGGKTYY
jgi:hypothetical protein